MIKDIKQGRNKKHEYHGVVYDSLEEVYMQWYINELSEAGIIQNVIYQPAPILLANQEKYTWVETLKTKDKYRQSVLLEGTAYTYDFEIVWHETASNKFFNNFQKNTSYKKGEKKPYFMAQDGVSRIDVKGGFAPRGSNLREFEVKRKWAYQKTGLFVQKIIPEKLFQATFTPKRYLFCDKLLSRKRVIKYKANLLVDFLRQHNLYQNARGEKEHAKQNRF
jgi:hypothetical protein